MLYTQRLSNTFSIAQHYTFSSTMKLTLCQEFITVYFNSDPEESILSSCKPWNFGPFSVSDTSLSPYIFLLRFNEILSLWCEKRLLYIFIVLWKVSIFVPLNETSILRLILLFEIWMKLPSYDLFCCLRNWICVFSTSFGPSNNVFQ